MSLLVAYLIAASSIVPTPLERPRSGDEHAAAARVDERPGFSSTDVQFEGGQSEVRLAGTLLLPDQASADRPVPGVVLVTGSGAQDRDESILGRKPFRVLAEGLARRGFAVLRYDDRGTSALGIGQSTGNAATSTLADTSLDAAAALRWLASRDEVDRRRIAACGHSTGGLEVAMLIGGRATEESDGTRLPGAAVLLAAPTVSGAALLARQQEDILRLQHRLGQSGMTDEQVDTVASLQREIIAAHAARDSEALDRAAERIVRAAIALQSPGGEAPSEMVALGVRQVRGPLEQPWMDHFLRYDPEADLRASRVPMLAVFGGLDVQVAPALNVAPATEAFRASAHPASAVIVLPTRNHLFQGAVTGLLDEYGKLTDEMGPELVAMVAGWLEVALAASESDVSRPDSGTGK